MTAFLTRALLTLVLLVMPASALAGPITWQFTGTASATGGLALLVPFDTPASIQLTVDSTNWFAGTTCRGIAHPEAASYAFVADLAFLGLTYRSTGYFEMNYDPFGCYSMPGVWQVQWSSSLQGPSLTGAPAPLNPTAIPTSYAPSGRMFNHGFPGCTVANVGISRCMDAVLASHVSDPLSPVFPGFSTYGYRMHFNGDCSIDATCPGGGIVTVNGALTAVPEPSTWLLLTTGLVAGALRVRRRSSWAR